MRNEHSVQMNGRQRGTAMGGTEGVRGTGRSLWDDSVNRLKRGAHCKVVILCHDW